MPGGEGGNCHAQSQARFTDVEAQEAHAAWLAEIVTDCVGKSRSGAPASRWESPAFLAFGSALGDYARLRCPRWSHAAGFARAAIASVPDESGWPDAFMAALVPLLERLALEDAAAARIADLLEIAQAAGDPGVRPWTRQRVVKAILPALARCGRDAPACVDSIAPSWELVACLFALTPQEWSRAGAASNERMLQALQRVVNKTIASGQDRPESGHYVTIARGARHLPGRERQQVFDALAAAAAWLIPHPQIEQCAAHAEAIAEVTLFSRYAQTMVRLLRPLRERLRKHLGASAQCGSSHLMHVAMQLVDAVGEGRREAPATELYCRASWIRRVRGRPATSPGGHIPAPALLPEAEQELRKFLASREYTWDAAALLLELATLPEAGRPWQAVVSILMDSLPGLTKSHGLPGEAALSGLRRSKRGMEPIDRQVIERIELESARREREAEAKVPGPDAASKQAAPQGPRGAVLASARPTGSDMASCASTSSGATYTRILNGAGSRRSRSAPAVLTEHCAAGSSPVAADTQSRFDRGHLSL